MHGQQQQPQQPMTLKDKLNTVLALAQFASQTVEPWLRVPGTAGKRHFGVQACIGTVIMFLWIAHHNPVHATLAFYAQGGIYVLHRLLGRWTRTPGESTHYTGYPWLSFLFGLGENACKGFFELGLVLLAGTLAYPVSPGVGSWLWATALGLAIQHTHITMRDRAIDDARSDAMAQQRIMMQRWGMMPPQPRRTSKFRTLLLLSALGGGGYAIYNGNVVLPPFVGRLIGREVKPPEGDYMPPYFYSRKASHALGAGSSRQASTVASARHGRTERPLGGGAAKGGTPRPHRSPGPRGGAALTPPADRRPVHPGGDQATPHQERQGVP